MDDVSPGETGMWKIAPRSASGRRSAMSVRMIDPALLPYRVGIIRDRARVRSGDRWRLESRNEQERVPASTRLVAARHSVGSSRHLERSRRPEDLVV